MSDVVSAFSPTELTEIALVIFLVIFIGVLVRHGGKRRAAEHAACAQLPLEDDR